MQPGCHLWYFWWSFFSLFYFKWSFVSYTPVETQTPDEILTAKVCLDMPADVADEKEELTERQLVIYRSAQSYPY